ncbi:MAG: hypothetical protein Q9227_006851 [Pyrenula ochraceoflavens]
MTSADPPSYIDYDQFLSPSFSPQAFANTLVTSTNNPSDTPLDLSTPLSRVLFDLQEIDTHIHALCTQSSLPLLNYTQTRSDASSRILSEVSAQVEAVTKSYERLEREVSIRHEAAEEVRIAAARAWETLRLGRTVSRCLALGRQLEAQMSEAVPKPPAKEDHRALVRATYTLLSLREIFESDHPGREGEGLERVKNATAVRSDLAVPAENMSKAKAQQTIREFSMSSLSRGTGGPSTFAQTEEAKAKTTSAVIILYLLSPSPAKSTTSASPDPSAFSPILLLSALQTYLQTALTASLTSLARALSTLPTLERTLLEVSARCQNIVALEALLASLKPPNHPLLAESPPERDLLAPLLTTLDTSSLPSYFWRSLASSLSPRVQEILSKGGVSARTLRSNRERVRDSLRDCVLKGSQLPGGSNLNLRDGEERGGEGAVVLGNWEREAAVMVSSVVGVLGR